LKKKPLIKWERSTAIFNRSFVQMEGKFEQCQVEIPFWFEKSNNSITFYQIWEHNFEGVN
jgi:hypothetical protein